MKKCAKCLFEGPDQARYCQECGTRLNGAPEAYDWKTFEETQRPAESPSTMACPRCSQALMRVEFADFVVEECRRCGGCWYPKESVMKAFERFRVQKAHREGFTPFAEVKRFHPVEATTEYVKCPKCGGLMVRANFEEYSGIIIDRCGTCGVWLDAGEFEKISQFLDSGGHEYYLRRKYEELEEMKLKWREGGRKRP